MISIVGYYSHIFLRSLCCQCIFQCILYYLIHIAYLQAENASKLTISLINAFYKYWLLNLRAVFPAGNLTCRFSYATLHMPTLFYVGHPPETCVASPLCVSTLLELYFPSSRWQERRLPVQCAVPSDEEEGSRRPPFAR